MIAPGGHLTVWNSQAILPGRLISGKGNGMSGELPEVAGIDAFVPVAAPPGVWCWSAEAAGLPPVSVVVQEPATVAEFDADSAAARLAEVSTLVTRADDAVRRAVIADPARFGLDAESDPGCDEPEIVFFTGSEWLMRFAVTALPACVELGVAVHFDGVEVVEVDDLTEAVDL